MKKFIHLVLLYSFILTACASQPPAPTDIPTALPANTPTATPLSTFTPTLIPASVTPEQAEEQTAKIAELNAGWNGHISINAENQFLNKDGQVIDGLVYNPESGMAEITRSDAVGYDFTEQFDPALIEVGQNETGEVDETINYNLTLNENGQLERLKYPGTSEYGHSQTEIMRMIADNHSTEPGADLDTVAHIKAILSNFLVKPLSGSGWDIAFGDFRETQESDGTFFGTNKVKIWNSATQKEEIIRTSEYAVKGFGGKGGDSSYVVVVWMDANDNPIIKIVHGPMNLNRSSSWWGITP